MSDSDEDPLGPVEDSEVHDGDGDLSELAEDVDEDDEDEESSEVGKKAAEKAAGAANGIRAAISGAVRGTGRTAGAFFGNLLSPVPMSGKIWKGMAKRSLYNYHKTSGGDRLGLEVGPNGKIQLTPVKWKSAEACTEGETPGWKAKGKDDSWRATTLGQSGPRIGKTPVIPLDTESWRASSILEARVAEAIDQGDMRPLYRVDDSAELKATLEMQGGAGNRAVADGGAAVNDIEFDPGNSPIFDDMIIDLGSEEYDGQAVSWWKTKELLSETSTQEEMAHQEERGVIAGRSRKDMAAFAKRIFLYASLVALGGLIGPELVTTVLGGGGGGGGGSIIPIMTGVF